MADLFIGTCSWKYDSWMGIIYPEFGEFNYLKEYSLFCDSVEIDQWFWSLFGENKVVLPDPATVEEYSDSVGDNFKFTVKMPNSITLTHFYRKNKNEELKINPYFFSSELFKAFMETMAPLKDKSGPYMLQFEYLNKQKMASQKHFEALFADFLGKAPSEAYDLAVEIRNPNYLNDEWFSFIADNKLVNVFLQGYFMPPVYELYKKYGRYIKDKVIIRLHGPDRSGIEKKTGKKWNRIVEPRDEELDEIVKMIHDLLSREVDVYLNVNNHYEGSAPLTIEKIREMIKKR